MVSPRARPTFWVLSVVAVVGALGLRSADPDPFERVLGRLPPLVAVAVALAAVAIAFDLVIPFDEDINVAWPESVLFYPAVALLAEVVLHLLPLAILVTVLDRMADHRADHRSDRPGPDNRTALAVIVAVAAVEAALQTASALDGPDRRSALFVAPHLLVIGVVELSAFRRWGFAALATFRLSYYLVWHVLWGPVRLELLF